MDHLFYGPSMYGYRSPHPLPSKETIETFADVLPEIVHEKLTEGIARMDELRQERKEMLETVTAFAIQYSFDEKSLFFWTYFVECLFIEYGYAYRWALYWLRLLEEAVTTPLPWTIEREKTGISQQMIDQAKQVPLEDLFLGKLRRVGRGRSVGCCPFHQEKTPSFTVFSDVNTYYCFGCRLHGDVIDFIMRTKNIPFLTAVKELQ